MVDRLLIMSRQEMVAGSSSAPFEGADVTRDDEALVKLTGTVKWFDATRGFGFIVSDAAKGDILIHFSVLKEHDRRSLPEGAIVECLVAEQERGLQARKVLGIDLSKAVVPDAGRHAATHADRIDPSALIDDAGPFEPVRVKWFNRLRGYGFLIRDDDDSQDIFVHMETVRQSQIADLQPGQQIEARIAEGRKGLTAVELREF